MNAADNNSASTELRKAQIIMLQMLQEVDAICRKHDIKYWLDAGTLLGAIRHGGFIPWDDDLDISMMREDYERFLEVAPSELSKDRFLQTCESDKHFKNTWLKIRDRNSLLIEDMNGKLHQGVFIDIFPFDYYSEKAYKRVLFENFYKYLFKLTKLKHTPIKYPYMKPKNLIKNIVINTAKFIDKITPWHDEDVIFSIVKNRRSRMLQRIKKSKSQIIGYGVDLYKWRFEVPVDVVFPLKVGSFEGIEFMVPNNPNQYLRTMFGADYMTPPPERDRVAHSKVIKTKLTEEEYWVLNNGF